MNHTNGSTPLAAPREMRPVDASIVMTFLSIKLLEAIILILLELELDDAVKVLGAVVVVCTVDLGGAGVTFFDGGASVKGCVAFRFVIPGAVDIFREGACKGGIKIRVLLTVDVSPRSVLKQYLKLDSNSLPAPWIN
jgi:hypothetical protein